MALPTIVLARIDDRLIHGQVMTAWVKYTNATKIYIIDDAVAKDPFMGRVLTMAAPSNLDVKIFSEGEAAGGIKEVSKPGDRIIILVKTPAALETAINDGLDIEEIVVGGMGSGPARKKLYRSISISDDEKKVLEGLVDKGVRVIIRILPDDRSISLNDI